MKLFKSYICCFVCMLCFHNAVAENILTSGQSCEDIKPGEMVDVVKNRATDAANYFAVENMPVVQKYRTYFNDHDFNVLIYKIIDEATDNLLVTPVSEDDTKVCVEVNIDVDKDKYTIILDEFLHERGTETPTDVIIESVSEDKETVAEQPVMTETNIEDKGLVFVAPTVFYNGAVSENHSKLVQHYMGQNNWFYITTKEEIADYIVYPRVEKARIEHSEDGTGYLSMNTLFVLTDVDGEEISSDKQERSIMLDDAKTEQQNAQDVMKKMFAKSSGIVSKKIENLIEHKKIQQ